ncbi:glycosyl transferase family 1, partial [Staphylococcus epidermidis]
INHFDIQQRKIRRDFYDTRGFLSCSRILTSQQKVVMEQFFTPTQKVKFQKYYNPEHEHPTVQSIIYNTSRGVRFFNDENELLAFAINALYH